jgi:ATP-dependent Lon protease
MEVINLRGYIGLEEYQIARKYLLPEQVGIHGLKKGSVTINKEEFMYIINGWAREAGVRNLERQIERICRKSASLVAKGKRLPSAPLSKKKIREYLGLETFTDDDLIKISRPGIAVGLAWTSLGGSALVVESIVVSAKKGTGGLKLTGQLGDVMSESANIAYSYIQNLLDDDSGARDIFKNNVVHVHVPAGATPKDGPSAGITIASSIYSVVAGKKIKKGVAMTGELTLTGRVLPVGGIKEKIIAAKKAGLKSIILPGENSRNLNEISENIKRGLKFLLVDDIDQVISAAFEKNPVRKRN